LLAATASDPDPSAAETKPPRWKKERGLALPEDWEELGHDGFLELRLGMSKEAAVKTGRTSIGQTAGRCAGFYLAMYGDGAGLGAWLLHERWVPPACYLSGQNSWAARPSGFWTGVVLARRTTREAQARTREIN